MFAGDSRRPSTGDYRSPIRTERIPSLNKASDTMNMLNDMRLYGSLCDALIRVEDGEFTVHRAVVSTCTSYFDDKYRADDSELQVCHIPHDKADVMAILLNCVYCQEFIIGSDNVDRVLAAARSYNVRRLVDVCCSFMADNLDVYNCIGTKRLAHTVYCDALEKAAEKFILENVDEVFDCNSELLMLPVNELIAILSTSNLYVANKMTVFKLIIRWVDHDRENRHISLIRLLRFVPLIQMRPSQFEQVESHDLISSSAQCQTLVDTSKKLRNDLVTEKDLEDGPCCQFFDDSALKTDQSPELLMFVVGGWTNKNQNGVPIQTYNSRTDSWAQLCFGNQETRRMLNCVAIGNRVYTIEDDKDSKTLRLHCYDTVTDEWSEKAAVDESSSEPTRVSVVRTLAVLDGCLYAVGGSWFCDPYSNETAKCYKLATNKWRYIRPTNVRRGCSAAASLNGKLYVAGGFHHDMIALRSVECYDPTTNQWSFTGDMLTARAYHGLLAVGDFLYAVGGRGLKSAEKFDPSTNTWSPIADMHHTRIDSAIAVIDDEIVVAGGSNVKSVERYNIKTNTWKLFASEIDIRCSASSVCVVRCPPTINKRLKQLKENNNAFCSIL